MHFERGDDDLRLLTAMPKPELHLHLDGSLDPALALELAASRGVDAPRDWAGMRAALVAPERCLDQADLLRAFDLPVDGLHYQRLKAGLSKALRAPGRNNARAGPWNNIDWARRGKRRHGRARAPGFQYNQTEGVGQAGEHEHVGGGEMPLDLRRPTGPQG